VIQWLSDGRIDGGSMISHRFDFDKAVEAFDFAYSHRDKVIKAVIFNE
jgi:threonine dehydrogenase-like Zn-dependent dehydrogenase